MNILTIDTGTTNTRVTVWHGRAPLGHASREIGVRDTAITGTTARLIAGIRDAMQAAVAEVGLTLNAVDCVLASGMITSNLGLRELPHLVAPAGREALAEGMARVSIAELCPQDIWFVPGVRNPVEGVGLHNCEAMDMMRGEETETIALIDRLALREPAVIMLPGSHSKFVHVDGAQRIAGCITTIAGELLDVITHNTLLTDTLNGEFADTLAPEMLLAGARSAARVGLARACFTVRILDRFTSYERNARANYLLGAVFGSDLVTLKNSSAIHIDTDTRFVIAGKPLLREALAILARDDEFFSGSVTVTSDEQQADLAGFGAMCIAKARGLIQ